VSSPLGVDPALRGVFLDTDVISGGRART